MEAAGTLQNEKVHLLNNNKGKRPETYLIKGKRGSVLCCLKGPSVRKGAVGDSTVVIFYTSMPFKDAKISSPKIIFLQDKNATSKCK